METKRLSIRNRIGCVDRAARHARPRFELPEILEARTLLSTYIVTTADDPTSTTPGAMTLRQAIAAVNSDTTPDVIEFNIAGSGVATIRLSSPLPAITNQVLIDGTTQPGFAGTPLIELNGSLSGSGPGLEFATGSDGSTVKGLEIDAFTGDGVVLRSTGVTISNNVISGNSLDGILVTGNNSTLQSNIIGLDPAGLNAMGNGRYGLDLGSTNGVAVADVSVLNNTISANHSSGIYLSAASNNTIQGNLIGTDAFGNEAFDTWGDPLQANFGDGISLNNGSSGNLIGGANSAARNVISGNDGNGILGQTGSIAAANMIQGNYIGTDGTGLLANGNGGDAVRMVSGQAVVIGNVLSANYGFGLTLSAGGTRVFANLIGTGAEGATHLGNAGDGIYINSSGNTIGSDVPGTGNIIAFNGAGSPGRGVDVFVGTANDIQGNSIFSNRTLGIDLGQDGVTLNDSNNHQGANNYQNFPVITDATLAGSVVTLSGTLQSVANSTFTLDFFSNTAADASGYGQGQRYVGSTTVTTDVTGKAAFSVNFADNNPLQSFWSATATDLSGNTSEFGLSVAQTVSAPVPVASTTTLASSSNPSAFGQSVTFTATVAGGSVMPTGSVNFYDGSTLLATVALPAGQNYATFTTSSLNVSSHNIVATYGGDTNYLTSSATLSQEVGRAASTTTLTGSPSPSNQLQTVTFTATVTPTISGIVPTGTVTFIDGSLVLGTSTLISGVAALNVSGLSLGTHHITATYNSDGNFAPSTSNSLTQTVNPAPNSISGTIYRDVTGNGFSADDTPMSGVTVQLFKVANGKASLVVATTSDSNGFYTFSNLPAGTYRVQEVLPTGYVRTVPTAAAYYSASLTSGTVVSGDNFDNFLPAGHRHVRAMLLHHRHP